VTPASTAASRSSIESSPSGSVSQVKKPPVGSLHVQTSPSSRRSAADSETQFYSAWTFDHFVPPGAGQDVTGSCFEGWSALADRKSTRLNSSHR